MIRKLKEAIMLLDSTVANVKISPEVIAARQLIQDVIDEMDLEETEVIDLDEEIIVNDEVLLEKGEYVEDETTEDPEL